MIVLSPQDSLSFGHLYFLYTPRTNTAPSLLQESAHDAIQKSTRPVFKKVALYSSVSRYYLIDKTAPCLSLQSTVLRHEFAISESDGPYLWCHQALVSTLIKYFINWKSAQYGVLNDARQLNYSSGGTLDL